MRKKNIRFLLLVTMAGLFILIILGYNISPRNKSGFNEPIVVQEKFDFNPSDFKHPSQKFGPFTRWWWPGNDVTEKELKREIRLLANNGFAGVEIQPLTVGINPESARLDKVYSWDTPLFYQHVATVMEEALKSEIIVDLNAGSGWPMGGAFLKQGKSLLTLAMADTLIEGGRLVHMTIPFIREDYSNLMRNGMLIYNKVNLSGAKRLAVTAARIVTKIQGKIFLDSGSVLDLTHFLHKNVLTWNAPQGKQWLIMAFYSLPDGEKPLYIANKGVNWVTDFFDSMSVKRSYDHLFGARTGLEKYYGRPFRAVFDDSKEFITDRHISNDFIDYFRAKRGYDISPWLAANAIKGYNNAYSFGRDSISQFVFSNEDWRLRYDYDLSISDLYKERFSKVSRHWLERRGLLHRTQEYGIRVDIIGASGLASIPEAEQLFGGGSEGFIKLVTSGAHLYNRPVVSEEAFVFSSRAGMTTPQKIRAFANKSFAAGINQLVYHGTPYWYQTGDYGEEGWTAWSTPFKKYNYSSNISEHNNFWKYIGDINAFISRSQYALRAGKAVSDVLIYFPFINLEASQVIRNPEETCVNGAMEHVEPLGVGSLGAYKKNPSVIEKWFMETWPVINQLEKHGVTWDFVNDESLGLAQANDQSVTIRNNHYKALIISHVPYMPLKTALKIKQLAAQNLRLLVAGNIPACQPGYMDYRKKDSLVQHCFQEVVRFSRTSVVTDSEMVEKWTKSLPRDIHFNGSVDFVRQTEREMTDGSRIQFIWNKSDQVKMVSLTIDRRYRSSYWLNPEYGSIIKNEGNIVIATLPPYGSMILFASVKEGMGILPELLTKGGFSEKELQPVTEIKKWNIKINEYQMKNSLLFDWIKNQEVRYESGVGQYRADFYINKKKDKGYVLNMGNVYFTAEVRLNGKRVGKRMWPPYSLDITHWLKNGNNDIEIVVTPSNRNKYVGEGINGNPKYSQFEGLKKTLMPAGLIGPVLISEYLRTE